MALQTSEEALSFRRFREEAEQPRPQVYTVESRPEDDEQHMDRVPLEALCEFCVPGRAVIAQVVTSDLAERMFKELQVIPEAIRRHFVPCAPIIHAGWHDLFECSEVEAGHLFGRCQFSVSFMGWGCPRDWQAYRRIAFQQPIVVELRREFERFLGPVQTLLYWEI